VPYFYIEAKNSAQKCDLMLKRGKQVIKEQIVGLYCIRV
jgi:hypothetical protein